MGAKARETEDQMTSPTAPGPVPEACPFDVSEEEIDASIAACGGDLRATIRALLIGQAYLEHEMSRREVAVSSGFLRRRVLPS